jgi:hypothetical protein
MERLMKRRQEREALQRALKEQRRKEKLARRLAERDAQSAVAAETGNLNTTADIYSSDSESISGGDDDHRQHEDESISAETVHIEPPLPGAPTCLSCDDPLLPRIPMEAITTAVADKSKDVSNSRVSASKLTSSIPSASALLNKTGAAIAQLKPLAPSGSRSPDLSIRNSPNARSTAKLAEKVAANSQRSRSEHHAKLAKTATAAGAAAAAIPMAVTTDCLGQPQVHLNNDVPEVSTCANADETVEGEAITGALADKNLAALTAIRKMKAMKVRSIHHSSALSSSLLLVHCRRK